MPDFTIGNHGSVVLVTPETEAAQEWVAENVHLEDWQWFGRGFACEPRCVADLIEGIRNDDLSVED